ncbi:MAG: MMPL family transporter [Candidatus Omnitrophica bacterium]|nr:MMPL family transporter [Candidatus Omnitrophota bacterium]
MGKQETIELRESFSIIFKQVLRIYKALPREVITFILLALISMACLFTFVDLAPTVDDNLFFSSNDPQFQSEHLIDRLFVRKDAQLILSVTGKITDEQYKKKIHSLSEVFSNLEGIASVNSLTHAGPGNLRKAIDSPLWKRLIISNDRKSTNLIVLLSEENFSVIVPKIEEIMAAFESKDFHIRAAGLPYVVELIKRNLMRDLKIFSLLACVIFGLFIFFIFRSKSVLVGTMVSCLSACMWTFMITDRFSIPMGILTANLGTIIFVMTLSHIIFLTFNWRTFRYDPTRTDPVKDAVKITFSPSFWSMFTTLLGFVSLTAVSAKPLRDLGISGAIGSLVAIAVAYSVFPVFLRMSNKSHLKKRGKIEEAQIKTYKFIDLESQFLMLIIFVTCLLTLPGLTMVNSDPSLLSYFSKKSEIYKGFSYIDRNGGSSPLVLVVRPKNNKKIHSNESYDKLWRLQESLEQHRSVGSVISLPVLIAQAHETAPFGWMLPRHLLLSAMELPSNDEIAKSFVTKDRRYGLFLLRMIESYRTVPRLEIIEEIKKTIETEGFYPEIIGGVYNLQGHLAKLVAKSLVWGLLKLSVLFAIIAWVLSRSLRVMLAVTASIFIIPLTILGCFGIYRIPLDIISAPASNVAIAMGIDSMIHMIKAFRRKKDWQAVRDELWQPILTSTFVVGAGFSIFLFSTFPPTQRFGGAILLGTLLAGLTSLYILPMLYHHIRPDRWLAYCLKKKK